MAQLDAQSLLNFDIAMQGAVAAFKSLFKKAQLPALCKYRYESDGLSGTMSKALSWVMTRECDVNGFILKVEGYKSPIFYAVDKGLYELAELLLTQGSIDGMLGVNDGEYSRTAPLHQAVYRQRVDLVTLLLAHGANPNLRDNSHYTSLQGCCSEAHHASKAYELAKALLSSGDCDLNVVDAAGQTPLIWESAKGRSNMVELLVKDGKADLNHIDEIGSNALYYAAKNNNQAVVRILLLAGADPDLENANGRTSLHVSARRGHVEIAKLLLKHGASSHLEDVEGKCPWKYVAHAGPKWSFLRPPPPLPSPSNDDDDA